MKLARKAGFDDMKAAADAGTAFVFMGHGTSHTANVTYDQMQTQMDDLGFTNAFIGTVEGEPEDTACDKVIEKVKEAGFKNVILRPLMVVAGDHATNDMVVMVQIPGNLSLRHPVISTVLTVRSQVLEESQQ